MRVFCAGLGTETNSFSPLPTGLASFHEHTYFPAGTHPDAMSFYGGPLWVARRRAVELGWTVHEGLVASAQPGGLTTRLAYETLRDELLGDLTRAMPADIVMLGLHGAMLADGYDDCEGDLLARVRAIVGPAAVIGAELDPHVHLSELMVRSADILVAFKEYPHTDIRERAEDLVELCSRLAQGRIYPVAALVDCEMVVPIHTTRSPAREFVDRLLAMEGKHGILSISVAHGFATGDTPEMGTKVLVYADGDAARAARVARELADELIGMRDGLRVNYLAIDEAIDRAVDMSCVTANASTATAPALAGASRPTFDAVSDPTSARRGPIVLADRSDNPGSGAAGDSTYLLARLIARDVQDVALGPLWDPGAVRIALDAGEGATLAMRIGGKAGVLSGQPVDAQATVRAVRRDMHMTGLAGTPTPLGDCALIQVQGIDIVLCSLRNQAMNIDVFTQLGCDVARKRIVVVKSAQHFHASFSTIAAEILYVAAPGTASPHWEDLVYRKVRLPKWPLRAGA